MHAIRLHAFGPPEHLRYVELPDLRPGPGQVRIDVEAAGVHVIDTSIRAGRSGGPFPLPELPMTPGREVAGTVAAAGPDIDGSWAGRRVVAHLGQASGGYAAQALAPATSLHALPDAVAADAAVAMIGTGRTALAILEVAAITAADTVLVLAAAGGLGTLLTQAARAAGATVVGAAGGPAKAARIRPDVDVAADYDVPGWAEDVRSALGGRGATVVLDGVGGEQGGAALDLLDAGGRLVIYGSAAGAPTAIDAGTLLARGITATAAIGARIFQRPGGLRDIEERSLRALADGTLTPVVGQRFALRDAAGAHRAIEARATVGKTVLVP